MGIVIIFTELRQTQTAVTHANDDGSFTILVNKNKCPSKQLEGIIHEVQHIKDGDFSKEQHAGLIEQLLHTSNEKDSLEDINFYYKVV